ncbi:MAG: Stp1/IreP family PP2C-type Ser/Thr phosphatase [Actinomycetota bacterium]|nr:Stp1/IreP family PP2C-type Ser/Thr phosphatase [Actinomycetota bacterium]
MPVTTLRAGSATDVGLVRANNQDQALVASPLFAVADGMGGHAAGEVAAELACQALAEAFSSVQPPTAEALVSAAQQANRAVFERALANPEMRGMGTTLVAVALIGNGGHESIAVAHVGDSRVYLVRHGEISQVTADHSLVAELVAEGQIAAEDAARHPQRHVLSRALGVYPDVDVDLTEVDPRDGDRLLLCSDGLSREVSDHQIASVLRRLADPDDAARQLVEEAIAKGGADNITVVIVDVVHADGNASAEPTTALGVFGPGDAGLDDGTGPDKAVDATRAVPTVGTTDTAATKPSPPGPLDKTRRQRRGEIKATRGPRAQLVTVRSVAFVIVLLAVAAIAVGGIEWYARSSYYVGLSGDNLTIYQGRPGGVLWIHPTVAVRTGVTTAQIEPRHLGELNAGKTEDSLAAARQYVANVRAEEQAARAAGSGSANPTTSPPITVAPPGSTRNGTPIP